MKSKNKNMDEIKLTKWKERFEQEVKNIQVEDSVTSLI
jgi:hypothetical protein